MGKARAAGVLWVALALLGGTVLQAGPTASFTATPDTGQPTLTVNVNGTASTGTGLSWSWDWGDGSPPGTGSTAMHDYTSTGTFFITLTVTDNLGATGQAIHEITCITVGNFKPQAVLSSANPPGGFEGVIVTFSGLGHDDTMGPLEHRWDYGDGSPTVTFSGVAYHASTTPQHTYMVQGTYVARLRVKDTENVYHTDLMTIVITAFGVGGGGGGGGGGCGATGLEIFAALLLLRRLRAGRRK